MAATQPAVLADVVPRTWARQLALVVGAAAFVGLAAQVVVPLPFTPVPLTLQTFAVLLVGASLGTVRGVLALSLYAIAGMAGVPWFAAGSSGIAMPSFGYILGFIAAAAIVGRVAEGGATRTVVRSAGLMLLGTVAIYAIGMTWLKFALDVTWSQALALGVTPFVIGDLVKVALAAGLLPLAWAALKRLRLTD